MGQVTLRALRKSYGAVEVIRGIDLEVRDGEFMVFVGPSGCGKSTVLRMIAGLEGVSGGDLLIDGTRANDMRPADRGVAMVFQSYALYPHMTVAENMGFALRMAGIGRAERDARVRQAAQSLRLDSLLARYPKELSGGQRQRVAIGRAIVRQPQVFLFDEPLSNLDAALRVDMRVEMRRLHQTLRATMIYVTHDQVEAMTLADRIAAEEFSGKIRVTGALHHPRDVRPCVRAAACENGRRVPPRRRQREEVLVRRRPDAGNRRRVASGKEGLQGRKRRRRTNVHSRRQGHGRAHDPPPFKPQTHERGARACGVELFQCEVRRLPAKARGRVTRSPYKQGADVFWMGLLHVRLFR